MVAERHRTLRGAVTGTRNLPTRTVRARSPRWDRRRCFTCEREAWLDGFTESEFEPGKLLATAIIDQARKHREAEPSRDWDLEAPPQCL